MEIKDLSLDERFKDRSYVMDFPHLKYYFGIPLKVKGDLTIGSLCVMHEEFRSLSDETKEMLTIIAAEIVNKIKASQTLNKLAYQVRACVMIKNKLAHDIRGPIGGIVGLSEIIQIQGTENDMEEVLTYVDLINKSSRSVLELADEILSVNQESDGANKIPNDHEFTLPILATRLLNLFGPQAITKHIDLTAEVSSVHEEIVFPKTNVVQILGNLISNSIKYTPAGGSVKVILDMDLQDQNKALRILVKDSGVGMSPEKITEIVNGDAKSSAGTSGEKGYGFGLNLVHQLVTNLKGQMRIKSEPGQGAEFELILPFS
jgi:signal transduction histidine kinase